MNFYIDTLGCKVNQYESGALAALLTSRGHVMGSGENCGLVIINTCAVTGEAAHKSRQFARRWRARCPGAIIAVVGCLSQLSPDEAAWLGADIVAGSGDRVAFVADLERIIAGRGEKIAVRELSAAFEALPAAAMPGRTRAMLKIQDGCDNFCAYCIIPHARGRVRSLPPGDAAREAARLVETGYREIVITGIEISSYGKDLDGVTLIDALRAISDAAGGCRLRLSSLDPGSVTTELIAQLAGLPNLCDHFHLSLQSGCDATLRRMRRLYDAAGFYAAVETLRRAFPNCGMTTDLIAGFPGETEGEFAETLAFIEKCAFSAMHVFPYSVRPGTPAAMMPGYVGELTRRERARRARDVAARLSGAFLDAQVGRTLSVLFEREAGDLWRGHTANYLEVVSSGTNMRNVTANMLITGVKNGVLLGELDI
jgi:threonylcarbamoyladenosine tRNA methylthiotransferase MtaB